MLTVTVKPELLYSNLQFYHPDNSIADANEVLNSIDEDSYFYISNGSTINRASDSLVFHIPENNMEIIPSSAIINGIKIILRTKKENTYGTYDNLTIKINGNIVANIDATVHNNEFITTEFYAEQIANNDIYKSSLSEGNFEIVMSTEGKEPFKLYYVLFQITYTEISHTSICKIQCKDKLFTLPLYNPAKLSRYAFRIVTPAGIKAFDLVSLSNSNASPLRLMTNYGLMAVRYLNENEEDNSNNIKGYLIVYGEDGSSKFELTLNESLDFVARKLPSEDNRPAISEFYLESPSGMKYILLINSQGEIRTEFATDQDIEILEIYKISKNDKFYQISVEDNGNLKLIEINEIGDDNFNGISTNNDEIITTNDDYIIEFNE